MKKRKFSLECKPVLLYFLSALILLFLILPVLVVIPMSFTESTLLKFPPEGFSFQWYEEFFGNEKWLHGALVSLKAALGTTVFAVLLGGMGAIGVSRKVLRRSKWVKLIMMLPMMLPSVIVAVSMYMVFGNHGLIGNLWVIIAAHTCLAIPMVVALFSSALIGLDPSQYNAARVLGATHWQAIIRVVLPLIKPAIFSSCLFAFITSFDESVLVLFITNTKTQTLTRLIFAELKYGISPALAAVSTLLICITLAFFFLSRGLSAMGPSARAARFQIKAEKQQLRMERRRRSVALKKVDEPRVLQNDSQDFISFKNGGSI